MSNRYLALMSVAVALTLCSMGESAFALKKCSDPMSANEKEGIKECFKQTFNTPNKNPGTQPSMTGGYKDCLAAIGFDAATCNGDSGGFDSGSWWCNTHFAACKSDCKKAMASNKISGVTGGATNYPSSCGQIAGAMKK